MGLGRGDDRADVQIRFDAGQRLVSVGEGAHLMLKGAVAVLVMKTIGGTDAALAAGFAAVLGHVFPVWLNFKGGKGVATYIGVLIAVYWPVALCFGIIWIVVAGLFRYSSLAGLIATLATPALLWVFVRGNADWVFAILTALVWFMFATSRAPGRPGYRA